MRVVTFNVLSSAYADADRRRSVAAAGLRSVRPDIVALQETTLGEGAGQARDLLGPGYAVLEHPARAADQVGSVLASRWPVTAVAQIELRVPPRVPSAAALAVMVALPEPIGATLVVHLHAAFQCGYAAERERQAVRCARWVDQHAGRYRHVIVLGDFNDGPDSATLRFWTGRQSLAGLSVHYQDAWAAVHPEMAGHTFSPANPLVRAGELPLECGRRIDYILIRGGPYGPSLAVAGARLILDRPVDGVWASDHYGLLADLQPPPHPPGSWA